MKMESKLLIEKKIELIKKLLKGKNKYQGWFSNYDDYTDFIVKYKIEKITLKKSTIHSFSYMGDIDVKVEELLIGSSDFDEWEIVYGWDDIPESSWDKVSEDITSDINDILPQVFLGVNFTS